MRGLLMAGAGVMAASWWAPVWPGFWGGLLELLIGGGLYGVAAGFGFFLLGDREAKQAVKGLLRRSRKRPVAS